MHFKSIEGGRGQTDRRIFERTKGRVDRQTNGRTKPFEQTKTCDNIIQCEHLLQLRSKRRSSNDHLKRGSQLQNLANPPQPNRVAITFVVTAIVIVVDVVMLSQCHSTPRLDRTSVCPSVGWSVCRSITLSFFLSILFPSVIQSHSTV